MNTSRKRHRDGVGVAAPEPCCDEGQELSGGGGVAFRKLLDEVLARCKATPDYLTADFTFNTSVKSLRAFGCPESLIEEYDMRLAEFFGRRNEVNGAAKTLIELIMDNHSNINKSTNTTET